MRALFLAVFATLAAGVPCFPEYGPEATAGESSAEPTLAPGSDEKADAVPEGPSGAEAWGRELGTVSLALEEGSRARPKNVALDDLRRILGDALETWREARTDEQRAQAMRESGLALAQALRAVSDPWARKHIAHRLARAFNRGGDYGNALRIAEQSLAWEPSHPGALAERSLAYNGLGRHEDAYADAVKLLALNPGSGKAYGLRALANYHLKNYPQALEDARKAMVLNPDDELASRVFRLSESRLNTLEGLEAGRRGSAQRDAADYAQNLPRASPEKRDAEGSFVLAKGKSAPSYEDAPDSGAERFVDSLNQQAITQAKLGDYRGAIAYADKALSRKDNPESYYIRAAAQNMMGNHAQAVADATAVLERQSEHAPALDARSAALNALGRFAEASEDAERSLRLNPQNAYAYKNRASAREQQGDLQGMLTDYRKAAQLNPQFEGLYRAALAKYDRLASAPEEAASSSPDAPAKAHGHSFVVVLAGSLIGGFLIALGLLHVLSGRAGLPGLPSVRVRGAARPGAVIEASYQVLRTLGHGGMGVVYEAVDKALGRKVAIKKMREEIRLDDKERSRFLEEARTVAALHHPHIVDIHTIVEQEGELYLVFEFVQGRTLEDILKERRRLALAEAQHIARGVLSALAYAHVQGVVHRDLKPSNIMLTQEGWIKVMDFGIARHAKDSVLKQTGTQTVAGTPQYMAPEQESGEIRKESDLYALGVCLYEMLAGQRPFPSPVPPQSKLSRGYPKLSTLARLPPEIDALIDAALEPDPDKRIRSASEFKARLDSLKEPPLRV